MAGRAVSSPGTVAASTLGSTTDPATDRVMQQAQQDLLDLQAKARAAVATAGAQGDSITALTAVVAAIPTTGRLLAVRTLTGSGTYTPTAGTTMVHVRGAACGGGGGGATVGAAGGGGASGAYIDEWIGTPGGAVITGGAVSAPTIGGAGGNTAGGNGAAGSDATLVVNGSTITLKGGLGGQGLGAGADGAAQGGDGQAGSTAGAVQSPGEPSIRWSGGAAWLPGSGGQTPISGEARAIASGVTAPTGAGFGAGGAGGFGSGGAASAGGAGAGAGWIIEERS